MSGLLSKDVQLPLKFPLVKVAILTVLPRAVVLLKHDEGLENFGFLTFRSRTKDGVVGGDLSPTKNSKTERLGNGFESRLLLGVLFLGEEDISDGIVTLPRKLGIEAEASLTNEEIVGNTSHDTSTVTVPGISTGCDKWSVASPWKKSQLTGTSVGHITENVSRIAYNLVRCMAFDVTDEPDTTHIAVRVNKMRLLRVNRWKLGKLRLSYSQVNEREIKTE